MKDNFKDEYKLIDKFIAEGEFELTTKEQFTVIEPEYPDAEYYWQDILAYRDGYQSVINIIMGKNKSSTNKKYNLIEIIEYVNSNKEEYKHHNYDEKLPNILVIIIKLKNYIVRGYEIIDKYFAYGGLELQNNRLFTVIDPSYYIYEEYGCSYSFTYHKAFDTAIEVLIDQNRKDPLKLYTINEVTDLLEKNKFDFGPGYENPEIPTFYAIGITNLPKKK